MSNTSVSSVQRLKILYLYKILTEQTDETHSLSMPEIITKLESYGISAARKALYEDIEALKLYGVDIVDSKGRKADYRVVSREFELAELKLLVDAVQASKFITRKKSEELINKLEELAGKKQAQQLRRQVFVSNRIKTMNESIYYSVDYIHGAMMDDRKISFRYFDWNEKKENRLWR